MSLATTASQFWAKADRPGVRAFLLSIVALGIALILALYSGLARETGNMFVSSAAAIGALLVAAWVGVTLVPVLARRTAFRWLGYRMEYRITRHGWLYILGVILIALAALNTGNNLLFLVLACMIAVILLSGILSWITLSGISLRLELPEHIFAGQAVRAMIELRNEKLTLPSFCLRVEAVPANNNAPEVVLETPVFFPYIPRQERIRQSVPITFAKRGTYYQNAFRIVTRFPFGFLQKTRRMPLQAETVVYPAIDPTEELFDILPGLHGAVETLHKGRGQDLHALRTYVPTDCSRHVHWKASARLGELMVREFAREDDCRLLLVLDPHLPAFNGKPGAPSRVSPEDRFERAVTICASIAWHFFERNALLQFRSAGIETLLAPATENLFSILQYLALTKALPPDPEQATLLDLAASPDLFKVVVTGQPRGSIPDSVWQTSYVVFLDDL